MQLHPARVMTRSPLGSVRQCTSAPRASPATAAGTRCVHAPPAGVTGSAPPTRALQPLLLARPSPGPPEPGPLLHAAPVISTAGHRRSAVPARSSHVRQLALRPATALNLCPVAPRSRHRFCGYRYACPHTGQLLLDRPAADLADGLVPLGAPAGYAAVRACYRVGWVWPRRLARSGRCLCCPLRLGP